MTLTKTSMTLTKYSIVLTKLQMTLSIRYRIFKYQTERTSSYTSCTVCLSDTDCSIGLLI